LAVARIDRQRLESAAFPLTTVIQTRFVDLDIQGHVNNAAAALILQEARVELSRAGGFLDHVGSLRPVVASLTIEYAGEMHHPDVIEVSSGVLSIGRRSAVVGQLARQGGRTTLYAETVLVMTDPSGAAAIPEALRAAYERVMIRAPA
jgi:acyl-CoA thioester hydrolase